jgi:ABC-type phosphonate transport system ATPase subunit
MTDCILEAINSRTQAYISALTGSVRLFRMTSLSERQAKMRPQPINGLVHDKARDGLRRHVAGAAP